MAQRPLIVLCMSTVPHAVYLDNIQNLRIFQLQDGIKMELKAESG